MATRIDPLAGKPAPASRSSTSTSSSPPTTTASPIRRSPAQRVAFGTSGHRGSSLDAHVQRGAHPGDHPGDLRVPPGSRASTARSSSASTPTRSPSPRSTARSRCSPPTASTSCSPPTTATRRRRRSRTRSSPTTAAARRASPTASSSRRRTTRPTTAASSTTRRTAARPTRDVTDAGSRARANELLADAARGRQAHRRYERGAARADDAPPRLPRRLRRRPRQRHRHRRHPRRAKLRLGVDPLGGAGVHYWARDRRALRPRPRPSSTTAVDPTFRFMTRRLGRQDPHGLLVAVRDAAPDRAQGPLRRRLRQRHRPRPPRHRHAAARACCTPNHYLAVGDRLSVRAPAAVGGATRRSARRSSAAA